MNENTNTLATVDDSLFAITEEKANGNSIRHTTTVDTVDLFNILTGKSENCKVLLGQPPITVTAFAITGANVHSEKDDDDSPIVNKPVCHFLTDDGRHFSSMSNGICRNVAALIESGLTATPETPIKLQFVTVDTKKGTAYTFNLVR